MLIRLCDFDVEAELRAALLAQRAAYGVEAGLIGSREIPGLTESAEQLRNASTRETFWGCWPSRTSPLAGFVSTEPEYVNGVMHARIARLVVHPSWFRRGVGRALVRRAIAEARGWPVLVSTGLANVPARALYEAEGFGLVRERVVGKGVRIVEYRHSPEADNS